MPLLSPSHSNLSVFRSFRSFRIAALKHNYHLKELACFWVEWFLKKKKKFYAFRVVTICYRTLIPNSQFEIVFFNLAKSKWYSQMPNAYESGSGIQSLVFEKIQYLIFCERKSDSLMKKSKLLQSIFVMLRVTWTICSWLLFSKEHREQITPVAHYKSGPEQWGTGGIFLRHKKGKARKKHMKNMNCSFFESVFLKEIESDALMVTRL